MPSSTMRAVGKKPPVLIEYAKYYASIGLSVIPLKPKSKEPLVAWKEYQERPPTQEELERWFSREANIAIVTGTVSGNLVVVDFDSEDSFRWFLAEAKKASRMLYTDIANTWIVETGKGYHVYFKLPREDLVPRTRVRVREGVDIKAEGGYVVAPPSVHPSGKQYRFAEAEGEILGPPAIPEPITLTEEEWKQLLEILAPPKAEPSRPPVARRREIELSEEQILGIVDVLRPFYNRGYRDHVVFYLLGSLVKSGVSYESSRRLIERLADVTGDEEKSHRLYLVDYHYGRRAESIGLERLKGFSGLREVVEKQLIERGENPEEAQDKALEVVNRLNEILGFPIERGVILIPLKTGSTRKYYANDPRRGILILTRKSDEGVDREYVLGYYIERVVIHVNPSNPNDMVYTVVFKHPKTGDKLEYHEQLISSIVSDLESSKLGVRNPTKLRGAISSLIEAFHVRGLAEVRNKVPATGFFEIDGKLEFFESPKFRVNLPEVDREKAIDALRKLEELLEFYRFSDKALIGLYYDIQAPLGFVRKQYGRENKILFDFGEPHVGKTLRAKIGCYIWGVREDMGIVSGAKLTAPQLAERLSSTTFKITIDEGRNVLLDSYVVDMIKSSTTNIHIKSRIVPQLGYRQVEFHGYASLAINTNYVPNLYPGVEDRLIPVKWTVEDKRSQEEVEKFLQKLAEYKDSLAYIGSYLRDMFVRRWAEVKEVIMGTDQVEIGRKLLEMMYEELGLPKPEWLRRVEIKYEIEAPTPEEVFFDTIREDLQEAVRKAGIILEERVDGGFDKIDLLKESWETRIRKLGEQGFLPSYMVLGRKNVYIKTSVIEHIRRKKGVEIAGGLSNLAKKLGYRYDTKPGVGRCMYIPIDDLVARLVQEVSEEPE